MTTKTKSIEKTDKGPERVAPNRSFAQGSAIPLSQCTNVEGGLPQLAGNLAVQRLFRTGVIQAKLAVSHPGDPAELEADRIAEHLVSSAPIETIQRKCTACEVGGGSCSECQAGEVLQPKEVPGSSSQVNAVEYTQIAPLLGGGQHLPLSVRAFFEPRLARDFSDVRVHTDPSAANSTLALNANAYTVGRDIVFASGQYAPDTHDGRKLIAHELAHVVQQGKAAPAPVSGDMSGKTAAEHGDDKTISGQSAVHVGTHHETSIQRQIGPALPGLTRPMPPTTPIPWVPSITRIIPPPRIPPPVRWLPPPPIRPPVQPSPWWSPQTFPFPPVYPVPHEQPAPDEERKRDQTCGSRDLPISLVTFFPGSLGQGGRVKVSPLTRCPGNTRGSKPEDEIYEEQFNCIQRAGQSRNWLRGHVLHGRTNRSGDRNLHGPGDTAANLIIIDQSLNQAMSSWIESVVLDLVYGPFPHVLWYEAWVDSYFLGQPFFAESISVQYGPYDTESGTEGPLWGSGQFTISHANIPPYCPTTEEAGTGFPFSAFGYGSTVGFQSTMQICHKELESRVFSIPNGGLMVAINAKWVGRGPGEEAAGAEGEAEGCPSKPFHVALYQETFGYDDEISKTELHTGERIVLTWSQLESDTYYLEITTDDEDPYCCLEGDITVTTFDAPAPRQYSAEEIAGFA